MQGASACVYAYYADIDRMMLWHAAALAAVATVPSAAVTVERFGLYEGSLPGVVAPVSTVQFCSPTERQNDVSRRCAPSEIAVLASRRRTH
jgi:hypothetical protein